jgi:cysteinyl-tRNA synthetase
MDSVIGLKLLSTTAEAVKKAQEAAKAAVPDHSNDPEAAQIEALVAERIAAKKAKDFARADQIRDELTAKGIVVTDTPNGPVWERK